MSTVRRLVFLFVSLFALPLFATTYLVPTDAELIDRAEAIVVGTAVGSRVFELDGRIYTEYELSVDEVLKGSFFSGEHVAIREMGGVLNGRAQAVAGAPVYFAGESSLVFLMRTSDGAWRTWGIGLGKFDRVRGKGDQSFLLRGLDGHEINGWSESGEPHVESVRSEPRFLAFVRETVRGGSPIADYLTAAELASPEGSNKVIAPDINPPARDYSLQFFPGSIPGRWNGSFPAFRNNGIQSGTTNPWASPISNWNGEPNSSISMSYAGTTGNNVNLDDGVSAIVFNDSAINSPVVNSYCSVPGVVACTHVGGGTTHSFDTPATTFVTINNADIEISASVSGQSVTERFLRHEMGHALGFRHSNEVRTPPNSANAPTAAEAVMHASAGSAPLKAWDILAASSVYGGGPVCPTNFISSHPQDRTITAGSSTTLSLVLVGDHISPTSYQWYRGASGDTLNPLGTNASQSVTPPASGTSYWVRVTNGCGGPQNSQSAVITFSSCTQPSITSQPQSQTIQSGQTATLSVTATGTAPLTYLWYEQGLLGNTPAQGVNNQSTYTTPALTATMTYLVVVSNTCGSASSSLATVTVGNVPCTAPSITSGPSSLVIPLGGNATFSVIASGTAPLTYQWYLGQSGDTSNPIAGATSADYNTGPLNSARTVWVRVTNSCGSANSPSATAEVSCSLAAPFLSAPSVVNSGVLYTVNFGPSGGALSYEIQESTTADFANPVTRTEIGTTTTFIHTVAPPNPLAYYYRARAIISCLGINTPSAFSNSARTVVNPPAVPAAPPLTGIDVAIPLGNVGTPVQFQFILLPPEGTTNPAFTAVTDVPFLSVSPSQGTVPAGGITLTMTASAGGLPEGTSTGTVIVTFTTPKTAGPLGSSTAAVPVNVSAVSAAAPTPKSASPPANAMIIPAVAHADGIGAQFVSDVRIANTFTQSLKYRLTYTPSNSNGLQQGQQTTVTVGPGGTIALNDIVKQWYGVGALPGEGGKGVLEIRPESYTGKIDEDARSAYTTVATSRTYAKTPTGTLGQFIPGIPYGRFVGKTTDPNRPTTLSLQQIAQSSAYRTNLGLVEASGQPATVRIRVYNSDGQQVGGDFTESLQAGEFKQFDQYLATKGITLNDGRIQVDVTSDTGRITAYASVLDNVTADPMLIEATRILDTRSRRFVVPGLADAKGNGANWQSDVRVFNPTTGAIAFNMTYYPQGNPGGAISRTRTANPGQVVVLDNILQSTFGTSGAGSVHIETATESALIVTARTYDQRPSGTYGQFIPAVTSADAVGAGERALQILQVEHSDRFRTNVGLVEVSGQPVTVKITAIIPQRSTAPIITRQLAANESVQLNGLLPNFMNVQGAAYNARLVLEVVGGSGRVAGYASVIDNATQDPTYVPAQ